MTAHYSIRRNTDSGLVLGSRMSRRVAFAVGFLVLLGGAVVGFDPARELSWERAPLNLLYLLFMVGCLAGCLFERVVTFASTERVIHRERRLVGRSLRSEHIAVPEAASVRIVKLARERSIYALEVGLPEEPLIVDMSSWRSELEPMGKAVAAALGLPWLGAES